ncbi:MAG: alpha-ketoglutarate-dependent dioxygenase AlkB [Pseudomonadota bacterium]
MADLFGSAEALPEGVTHFPNHFDRDQQQSLLESIRAVVADAPLYTPKMPKTGKPMSVRMSNCGELGWVTDKDHGYRYQGHHPETGEPWPAMPSAFVELWNAVSGCEAPSQAALINFYTTASKMGLHQDRDEEDFSAPVVSISLGDDCRFRIGGTSRGGKTQSLILKSGDVLVFGGKSRLAYHGVDRIYPGTSDLLKDGGRVNVTLRRVG